MTIYDKQFIGHFQNGEYYPELLFDDSKIVNRISAHPKVKWKASRLQKL